MRTAVGPNKWMAYTDCLKHGQNHRLYLFLIREYV